MVTVFNFIPLWYLFYILFTPYMQEKCLLEEKYRRTIFRCLLNKRNMTLDDIVTTSACPHWQVGYNQQNV